MAESTHLENHTELAGKAATCLGKESLPLTQSMARMAAGMHSILKASILWPITHVRSTPAANLQLPPALGCWSTSSNAPGLYQQPSQGLWELKESQC